MTIASELAQKCKQFFIEIGELSYFAGPYFKVVLKPLYEFKELLRQCYQIGARSLLLIGLTGFIIGLVLTLQLLIVFGDLVALYGSALVENLKGDVSFQLYFSSVFDALTFGDLVPATIKSFFFGLVIGLVGCYKGYTSKKGTPGVGIVANTAMVTASLFLFVVDFIAVFNSDIFYEL